MSVNYITCEQLAEIIKSDRRPHKDYLVVDVRDHDFRGGNVKHALNKPSGQFLNTVNELVKDAKDVPLVVFHCWFSQIRGPKAARIYEETRLKVIGENNLNGQEIFILRDGIAAFQDKYKDDPDLVENWDKNVWADDWSSL